MLFYLGRALAVGNDRIPIEFRPKTPLKPVSTLRKIVSVRAYSLFVLTNYHLIQCTRRW